jgi:hypothetical protein
MSPLFLINLRHITIDRQDGEGTPVAGTAGSAVVASAPSAGRTGGRAIRNTLATIRSKTGLDL